MKSVALLSAGCVISFVAGMGVMRLFSPDSPPRDAGSTPTATSPLPVAPDAPDAVAEPDAASRFLARLRKAGSANAAQCRRLLERALDENDAAMRHAVAQRWAELAPADFWRWMENLTGRDFELHKPEIMAAQLLLLRHWARVDPDAAMAAVSTAAPLLHLSAARGEVFQSLLATEPEKACAMAARFTQMDAVWGIDDAVWKDDPARFAKATDIVPAGPVRDWLKDKALYEATVAWHREDPSAALAWIRARNPAEQCFYLPKVITDLAPRDLPSARKLVESLPPSMPQEAAGVSLVESWARSDAPAALAWADAHLLSRKLSSYDIIMDGAVESHAVGAAALAASLPPGNGRDRAVSRVAWQWSKQDSDAAMDWVASLPSDSARRAAFQAMGGEWVARNPDKAAAWMQSAPAADVPDFLVHRAARQLASRGASNALQWAAALPEEHRVTAMRGVVGQLVWTSPQPEFAPLLSGLPAPQQQLAVNSLVDNWAWSCQGRQPAWVETLTAPQRNTARQRIQSYSFLDAGDRKRLLDALE